jgi:hypothetical protein
VPPERILVETDHGWADPPAAIPCRIEWVEYLVAQQLRCPFEDVRRLVWENLARIVQETGTERFLPEPLAAILGQAVRAPSRGGVAGHRGAGGALGFSRPS